MSFPFFKGFYMVTRRGFTGCAAIEQMQLYRIGVIEDSGDG